MRITIDNGKIVSAQLHLVQYLQTLEKIDTAGCPEPFRLAWLDYVQTWERKLTSMHAVDIFLESHMT